MEETSTEQFFSQDFLQPESVDSCHHRAALQLGYARFDNEICESIDAPDTDTGLTLKNCISNCTANIRANLSQALSEICPQRRQEFATQFSDLSQEPMGADDGSRRFVTLEDASRLFKTHFGISPSTALTIWQRVASSGNRKLNETEYCLAAHLAEKFSSSELGRPGLTDSLNSGSTTSRQSDEEYSNSIAPDESLDFLLSPASASAAFPQDLPNISSQDKDATRNPQFCVDNFSRPPFLLALDDIDGPLRSSPVSELSFSKLAERSSSDVFQSDLGNTKSLPPFISCKPFLTPPRSRQNHKYASTASYVKQPSAPNPHTSVDRSWILNYTYQNTSNSNSDDENGRRQRHQVVNDDDDDRGSDILLHSNEEDEATGVAVLLPCSSTRRAIMAKVNEALLIRSKHSKTGSSSSTSSPMRSSFSSSSSSSFSSSSSSYSLCSDYESANFLPLTSLTTANHRRSLSSPISPQACFASLGDLSRPNDSSADAIEVLASVTGCDRNSIRQFSRNHRRKMLQSLLRQAKSTNHTLLRLNNELSGELKELRDQFVNLDVQAHHMSIVSPENVFAELPSAPALSKSNYSNLDKAFPQFLQTFNRI